ncbi:MAG: hypothetical protein ACRYG8_08440 [Janthinobacterium lividum]
MVRRLHEAAAARHEATIAHVGLSQACLLDLHTFLPALSEILQLEPDEPRCVTSSRLPHCGGVT